MGELLTFVTFIVLGRLCIMHTLPCLIKVTDGHSEEFEVP